MMDLQTIRDLSEEAGREAEEYRKRPYVFDKDDISVENLRYIPNLGDYLPKGWVRVKLQDDRGVYAGDNKGYGAYFVDASGYGRPGEPALTINEFLQQIKPGLGYGIVETGQFQIKIGAYAVSDTSGRKA